ncbi:hypothetical protein FIBSPDRAFT_965225 [Athelia psychrophila]|uniref:MARVEL domain-containing protein n=1 Tax=Athelia psychrophila TaxID=1759441 RepID=A0A165WVV7_9AGAM|nr:hypothetical protein FIBSPDRAFT_965225 [Fibularhizoctonia sp. CBS 109695]
MSRTHFLCCLPARLGVFIFSLLETLAAGFLAFVFINALIQNEKDHDQKLTKYATAVAIGYSIIATIVCLTSFAGFVGAIAKKARGIRAYATVTAYLLGVQIVWGVIGIIALWIESKAQYTQQCEAGQPEGSTANNDTCVNHMDTVKGVATGLILLSILLHAYQLHVIRGYADQLEMQHVNRDIILQGKYELGRTEDSRPMIAPDTSYAYADNAHSYGHVRGPSASYA